MIVFGVLALLIPSATEFAANVLVGIAFLLTGALLAYSSVTFITTGDAWLIIARSFRADEVRYA